MANNDFDLSKDSIEDDDKHRNKYRNKEKK